MTLKTAIAYTLAGLAAVSVATMALPRHVSVERAAIIGADSAAILALAASNAGFQRFNPYLTKDPNVAIDLFGPENGVGSGFNFDGRDGTGSQTVAAVTAERVTYAVDLGPLGQPTQAITATPTEGGAEVTWRVDADMG
ncbi:MAG: polyketide cyclase, partial [Pseudomonadota bacterium]